MAKGHGGKRSGGGGGGNRNMSMNMGGMSDMLRQAQKLQDEMIKTREELVLKEYSASAGGGMVTAVVTGGHELKSIVINPEAVDPDDVEMLQDLILAAVNEATRAAEAEAQGELSKYTAGMNLPF